MLTLLAGLSILILLFLTKDLRQNKSKNGTNLDTEKTKTEKSEQEKKKKKSDLFHGNCSGYCFVSHTNDDWIQFTEWKVWLYERCENERVVNTGLCALSDYGYGLLTSDCD
jgi:hypothetical protein